MTDKGHDMISRGFMLLPLTHERAWVRRMPWVTYSIVAITVGVLFSTSTSSERQRSDELLETALVFYFQHPSLVADSRLVPPDQQHPASSESDEVIIDELQVELDRLTQEWIASLDSHPFWRHGLVPAQFSLSGLLTHMFLHADFWHWMGNIFLFYLTGPVVEDRLNRPAFAALYIACGLVAGGMFAAQYPDLYRPLVGASGAIAGILGAFLVLQWKTKIRFLLWIIIPLGTFLAPAWLMLPLWFLIELSSAVQQDLLAPGGAGGVAYWAHVWGFVCGGAVCWAAQRLGFDPQKARQIENTVLERAHLALERGRTKEAWRLLAAEARERPTSPDSTLAFWQLATEHNRAQVASAPLIALISDQARRGDPMFAAEQWYELRSQLPTAIVEANTELAIAAALRRKNTWESAQIDLVRCAGQKLDRTTSAAVRTRYEQLVAALGLDG